MTSSRSASHTSERRSGASMRTTRPLPSGDLVAGRARFGSGQAAEVRRRPSDLRQATEHHPVALQVGLACRYEPEILQRTAIVADVHAYLVRHLVGRWVTSWASADPLGVIDMCRFAYAPALLDLVGLGEGCSRPWFLPARSSASSPAVPRRRRVCRPDCRWWQAPATDSARDWGRPSPRRAVRTSISGLASPSASMPIPIERVLRSGPYRAPIPRFWTLEAVVTSGAMSLAWFGRQVARIAEGADQTPAGCGVRGRARLGWASLPAVSDACRDTVLG